MEGLLSTGPTLFSLSTMMGIPDILKQPDFSTGVSLKNKAADISFRVKIL